MASNPQRWLDAYSSWTVRDGVTIAHNNLDDERQLQAAYYLARAHNLVAVGVRQFQVHTPRGRLLGHSVLDSPTARAIARTRAGQRSLCPHCRAYLRVVRDGARSEVRVVHPGGPFCPCDAFERDAEYIEDFLATQKEEER